MAALACVLEAAPRYFELVTGLPPGPAEADDAMIGCADVIRGYPTPDKAVIGLLLIAEPWQRKGIGRAFERLVCRTFADWPEITTARIGVVASNPGALAFWRKLGYRETGERRAAQAPFVADTIVLERAVAADAP
jgi:RimJ/RimL family protein N-acetyltransferase